MARWIIALRVVLSALAGLAGYYSHEPYGYWILGIVSVAGLFGAFVPWGPYSLQLRGALLVGWVHFLVMYLAMLPWIGEFVGRMPYIALAVFLSLSGLVFGGLALKMGTWRYGFIAFPLWYLAVEYARSTFPFGGFSWVRLAWGQINGPLAYLAPWGGPALVTLAAALVGCGLVTLMIKLGQLVRSSKSQSASHRLSAALLAGIAVILPLLAGTVSGLSVVNRAEKTVGEINVAAIQGNVPRMGLDFNAQRRAVLANHVAVTHQMAQETAQAGTPVDLVIWPENSSDVNPFLDPEAKAQIDGAVRAAGVPVMVGTITRDEVGDRNTMVVFNPPSVPGTGVSTGQFHHKHFLQPFGEYMPWRSFFRMFSEYVDQAGNFQPGPPEFTLDMGGVVVGVATCYEVAFDPSYRTAVLDGAQILSTPTNNATFGFTDMTYQQLAMSRLRAIEVDRALVVAATSGVSAMVAPDGRITQETGIFESAYLVQALPLREGITVAARFGFHIELALVMMGTVLALATSLTLRRSVVQSQ